MQEDIVRQYQGDWMILDMNARLPNTKRCWLAILVVIHPVAGGDDFGRVAVGLRESTERAGVTFSTKTGAMSVWPMPIARRFESAKCTCPTSAPHARKAAAATSASERLVNIAISTSAIIAIKRVRRLAPSARAL